MTTENQFNADTPNVEGNHWDAYSVKLAATPEEREAELNARIDTLSLAVKSTEERWQEKWTKLEDALIAAADERDWCSDYDEFAEENGLRSRKVRQTLHVTLSLIIPFEGNDDDDERTAAVRHHVSGLRFYDIEEGEIEIHEIVGD